jgi:hypothetical protein
MGNVADVLLEPLRRIFEKTRAVKMAKDDGN